MNECDIEYPPCDGDEDTDSSLPAGVELRPMEPGDLEEVKSLHEQCFPVRYDMAFYENVVRGVIVRGQGGTKEPLYTQVAVVPVEDELGADSWRVETRTRYPARAGSFPPTPTKDGRGESGKRKWDGLEGGGMEGVDQNVRGVQQAAGGATDGHNGDGPWPLWSAVGGSRGRGGAGPRFLRNEWVEGVGVTVTRRRRKIVGLITCQVIPLERCRDRDRLGLRRAVGSLHGHSEVVYILTLGTDTAYRRRGIGRALLRRCVDLSRQEASIGAVYLHVITTNPPAHRFYESEGFVQLCCITDYYKINEEMYDCFLYSLFMNGSRRPSEWSWTFQDLSRRLRAFLEFVRRSLPQIPEEGRLAAIIASAFGTPRREGHQIGDRPGTGEDSADEEQPHDGLGGRSTSFHAAAATYGSNDNGAAGDQDAGGMVLGSVTAAQPRGKGFAWAELSPSSLARNGREIRRPPSELLAPPAYAHVEEAAAEVRGRMAPTRYQAVGTTGTTWWNAANSARGSRDKAAMEAHPFGGSGDRDGVGGASIIEVGGYGSVVDVPAQENVGSHRAEEGDKIV